MFLDGGANPNSAAAVTGIFKEKRLKMYRLTDIERKAQYYWEIDRKMDITIILQIDKTLTRKIYSTNGYGDRLFYTDRQTDI